MKALLLIDLQNGFCPGGNLAVAGGDAVMPVANRLMREGGYDFIVASQDWHPANHGSFASRHPGKNAFEMGELSDKPQMLWPDHCVAGTKDAELHPALEAQRIQFIQKKGQDAGVDSYSAFRDNDRDALTGLAEVLKSRAVTSLDIGGLATDYCVKFSVLDALDLLPGVRIRFVEDLSRGITPEGTSASIAEMQAAGAEAISSDEVIAETRA